MENNYGKGAIKIHKIHRKYRQWKRDKVGATTPFNWDKGYDSLSHISPIVIKNQFQSDSCSGQATSYAIEIAEKLAGNEEGAISAKSIYAPIAYSGGGTTVSDLERQITSSGASLEALVPSYFDDGRSNEAWMTDKTNLNPKDALIRAGYKIVNVDIDMDSIASAIQQYGFVIWEIAGQNGNVPNWLSPTPQPPVKTNKNEIWRHFMCAHSALILNGERVIKALQSWGVNVGEQGHQYFTQDYIDSGYIPDVFTFYRPVPVSASPAIDVQDASYWSQFWQNVVAWYNGKVQPFPSVPIGSIKN